MHSWFRVWHGAATDPKWRTIARRAHSRPGDVWAVMACLMDRASQADERGSIAGFDVEVIADALGYDTEEVERIIAALVEKGVIASGRLTSWEKHQPKREDDSRDRVAAYRERKKNQELNDDVTPRNDDVTRGNSRLDTDKDTDKKDFIGALTLASPKPEKPKKPKAPSNDDQVFDKLTDALMPDTARALMDHRKRLGKPLTPKAAELIARDILKLPAAEWEAAAEMMIARGWQGFNVDWYRNATQPRQNLRFGA